MRNRPQLTENQFIVNGNAEKFKQATHRLNEIESLLAVMTGVDHAKADQVAISIAIEVIGKLLGEVSDTLNSMSIEEVSNA
ncbi:hypothetical protein B0187_04990 [Haemophilus paracuniculus]|uniref:Uncharacterized protein n=1 Tax=Haemophilus paracuniculus TaxID=734 RepID=A0A1T0ASN9_9PAST|nr:hypothetical protein [Haemophilus paracuniculus]OOR99449.1 hypothetical protein B0187_04990 [Haemophilus paracuniculus]